MKKILKKYIICLKLSVRSWQKLIADLLAARVNILSLQSNRYGLYRPFQVKILLRYTQKRKCFIAIFACFSFKSFGVS